MTPTAIRGWSFVHKWTSLVCTLFLLMLCITGLPLIFHDEIDTLLGNHHKLVGPASSGTDPSLVSLDTLVATALATRPGEVPVFTAFDNEGPIATVTTAPSPDSPADAMTIQLFNRVTGEPIGAEGDGGGVMDFILQLHTDMFLGLPGMLFLGVMGFLFFIAIVSGVVLYAPFMRKLDFGTIRTSRSRRVKWLDYHNLLGIVALAWMSVVGLTGVINAFATPIIKLWQANGLAEMTQSYAGMPALPPERYGSLDAAMDAARRVMPGNNPQFIAFPGGAFSSKHHYAVFFQGSTPITERALTPALIDAETGILTDSRPMPWYVLALTYSQPLHFGDYGGMFLKILWAILTVFTIIVLGSGVYLWIGKRQSPRYPDSRTRAVDQAGESAAR